MMDTNQRIDFISDYLANYKNKIRILNSCGLVDAALHFELFAQEVCKLWFGKRFSNLNIGTYTFESADLISDDKSIFVQVSTVKYISGKISSTLKKIRDSKNFDVASIENIKFFMLENADLDKVKDVTIGRLTFSKESDLITTKMILERAKTDLTFQLELYNLFQRDTQLKSDLDALQEAIENSKLEMSGIVDKINGVYEINRSDLVNQIKKDGAKNIAVLGQAGYGKSVICKKLVENESNVLYARSETLIEKSNLNEIWGFNLREVLNVCGSIFFFIDTLEFIADAYGKNKLLSYLFEITKDMDNVHIIISCRTMDFNAFQEIKSKFQIRIYTVKELSKQELVEIAQTFPVIKKLNASLKYIELLKCPLYINLIVSNIIDFQNIENENDFRKYIWENIICLKDNNVKAVVKQIVFDRAKNFLLYVNADNFDSKIISRLENAGILTRNKDSFVRLKLDIYEDICFERYFDDEFNKCRGDYKIFFAVISSMGRCVYRRYQIWVANKILSKENRDAIIHTLIFSTSTPEEWKKETMIGLIRSRFSGEFFAENADELIQSGLIGRFIHLTNLYGFEINSEGYSFFDMLLPSGQGRNGLIELVYNKDIYKVSNRIVEPTLKLISDYCKCQDNQSNEATNSVVKILEYYLKEDIKEITNSKGIPSKQYTISILKPLYEVSNKAKELIIEYWKTLESWYKGDKEQYAKAIIEFTISFENSILAITLPDELCALAEMFLTYNRSDRYIDIFDVYEQQPLYMEYGLCKQADNYERKNFNENPILCNFFHSLFYFNFWKGLKWTVDFINKAALSYKTNCPNDCLEFKIKFVDDGTFKTYLGNYSMGIATTAERHLPMVLSDLLFCLQITIEGIIGNSDTKNLLSFMEKVKSYIFENSNNIALLSIISYLGTKFPQTLPCYALDLSTNIDLVLLDIQRIISFNFYKTNGRYDYKQEVIDDLSSYTLKAQINGNNAIREKCYKVLDYLYSVTKNDKKDANKYLQIQKMDLRSAKIECVDQQTISVSPSISGEAEKLVIQHEESLKPQSAVATKISEIKKKDSTNNALMTTNDYIELIELILLRRNNFQIASAFDGELSEFICIVLRDDTLPRANREKYCQILIEAAQGYLSNEYRYIFGIDFCRSLFEQLEADISGCLKKEIKKLILDIFINRNENDLNSKMSTFARNYFKHNLAVGMAIFNTIIKIAEDEKNNQKFNASNVLADESNEDFEFKPNAVPKFMGVDNWNNKVKNYKSQRNKIIREYLYNERKLKIEDFSAENYDIVLICHALNCGISLEDNLVFDITSKTVNAIIDIWKNNESNFNTIDILDVFTIHEIANFLGEQLINNSITSERIVEILFKNVDFSKFTQNTVDFYHNVCFAFVPAFFDAYDNKERRQFLKSTFANLELQILDIKENTVKEHLTKSLIFYFPQTFPMDWSKCNTEYSILDKNFINKQFIKYGGKYLDDIMYTINQLRIEKLLPEIIIPLQVLFKEARENYENSFAKLLAAQKNRIICYISEAFVNFSDNIKQDYKLTDAFEALLENLCDYGFEEAAIILDEFRIH